jgi:hypothetical protein
MIDMKLQVILPETVVNNENELLNIQSILIIKVGYIIKIFSP